MKLEMPLLFSNSHNTNVWPKKTICTLYLHISRKIFTEILGIFFRRFKGTMSGGVVGFICAVYWNPQSQVRVNVLTDDSLGGANCQDSV